MEIKKSKKADLEKRRSVYLQIGLVVALSIVLIAFEWTSKPNKGDNDKLSSETSYEVEEMQITRREEPKPEPIQQQKVAEILNIVDDNVNIDDEFNFNVEANQETEFKFTGFTDEKEEFVEEQTFYIVEDMPTFNGGDPAVEFRKYIAENMKYPQIASENGISGRVIVQFVVNSKGNVVDAVIAASVDPALDKEALRVVLSSPPWTPGKQRGKPVKVFYTFPINFILQ
jgi:periplasmic protein TonB